MCIHFVENREMCLMTTSPGWGGAQRSGLGTAVGGTGGDTKED